MRDEIQTGSELYYDIIKRRLHLFDHLSAQLVRVLSLEELVRELRNIGERCSGQEIFPYLHFEMHGSRDGVHLASEELYRWEELCSFLSEINAITGNNVLVSLATCHGAFIMKAIDILGTIPFFAFVGPVVEISAGEIRADWQNYFETLLDTRDIGKAIIALNLNNAGAPYFFYTGEQIFDIISGISLDFHKEKEYRELRLNFLHNLTTKYPEIAKHYSSEEIDFLLRNHVENMPLVMSLIKDHFLMRTDRVDFLSILDP
ncbi:MAG TPA: hypothetical protein VGN00_22520 [Puia sp.]|jgi:hypothetical protein